MIFRQDNSEQGSTAWLEARHGRLTASNASRLGTGAGLGSGAQALATEILAERFCPAMDGEACVCDHKSEFNSPDVARGNALEDEARRKSEREIGRTIEQSGLCIHTNPLFAFSPDGLIRGKDGGYVAGFEVKCPRLPKHFSWIYGDDLPDEHSAQVHFSMAVSGLRSWWFASYVEGRQPWLIECPWNDETDRMVERIQKFRRLFARIEASVVPKFQNSESENLLI